ncbi:sensor histidine kinase [Marinimicrobium sp. ARAG 43.8]|uniref:sensor histidine kinase n=1 Tax=Marinimicrobium sp. ARAG 43.8 TaxID=3418719 RepID=UPI003CEFB3D8
MEKPLLEEPDEALDFSFVLASSVHDMKNSLGMLLHTLETMLVENPPENDAQRKTFSVLGYEASRINSELVQLLSLYRMQEKSLRVQVDEHFVLDTLEDQIDRNDVLFQARGLAVDVLCDPGLNWFYDNELVGGVINNVLVNGARYSRERLQVRATVEQGTLHIAIADDGEGYPQSMLNAPLEKNAGVSFSRGSTNLGLLFARKVAALHRAENRSGRIHLANGGPLGGGVLTLILP